MIIKKVIACTLALCMMLGLGNYFPGPSFALSESIYTTYKASIESKYTETERQAFKVRIDDLSEYKGRNESQNNTLYTSDITIEQILYYLLEYKGLAQDPSGYDTRKINPYVYKKYKVIAYEELSVIEKDRAGHGSYERVDTAEGKELEYRYLGYTDAGIKITNDFYPADFKSGTDPRSRTYNTTSKATESWMSFIDKPHYGQLYQLMNTNLKNDDTTDGTYKPVGYTTFDLLGLNSFPGISGYLGNSNLRSAFGKVIKMQEPSLGVSGQFKLVHGTNKSYYDTFRTEEMTLHADVTIYPSDSVYFIAENQDQVTIEYEVRTIIDNDKTNLPYSNGLNISEVKISSEGNEAEVFSNPSYSDKNLERVLSSTFNKTVNLNHLDLSDGQDTVTIDASSSYEDMTGYTVNFSASPVQVKINAESDFLADFTIHNSEDDNVTDAHISVPSFAFTQPENVTLTDASATSKGNIISRTWYVLKNGSYDPISTSNESGVVFTVNADNRADVLNSNRLSFKLEVQTDLSLEKEVAIHEVTFIKSAAPQPVPSGPEAIIAARLDTNSSGDYITMEGDVFDINGRDSYHPEGVKLEKYVFNTNGGYTSSDGSKKNDYIYYLESGKYYPELTVTDANGGSDSDDTMIRVRPAEFIPVITIEGTLKENRKVSISVDNEHGLRYYPIDESSLNWTITPLDGQGNAVEIDGGADEHKSFDLLFNKKGRYQVSVTGDIYNGIKHRSGTATQIITIAEDLPPVVDFSVSSKLVRNVNNGNLTEITVFDNSYSPDGDIISQRKVWWRYNDDNDNDLGDTDWILASAGNAITTSIFTKDVGQYEIKEEVKEQFGQTTIAKFIVDADYKRSNSDSKADDEKRVEIINIAPTVTLDVANKKAVNLVIYHDYDAATLNDLNNKLDVLKAKLLGKQMELSTHYLKPTQTVGSRTLWTTYFDTYVTIGVHVVGDDEDRDDIDYTQTINILLDSFTSEGKVEDVIGEDVDRFELVEVVWGASGSAKYKYKNRRFDYTDYSWRELIVKYKENGLAKEKTYNFVTNYEYSDEKRDYVYVDAYDYDTYDIVNSQLITAQPLIERNSYSATDNTFYYNADDRPTLTLPNNTCRGISVKKYLDSELESVIEECKGDETYFLNLASKEENRLALNDTLAETLKSNNINYLTTDDTSLAINPLSGRFDDIFQGERIGRNWNGRYNYYSYYLNKMIITLGDLAYELDEQRGIYKFVGLASKQRELYANKFKETYMDILRGSVYSRGYRYYVRYATYRTCYGLEALERSLRERDEIAVEDAWDAHVEYGHEQGWPTYKIKNTFLSTFDENWYRKVVMIYEPETDGSIWGRKVVYDRHNYEFEYQPKQVASGGYIGILKNDYTVKNVNGYDIRGYVHDNGNIYFKDMRNFRGDFDVYNYMTITEGIDNIELMKVTPNKEVIYVYTSNQVIKYDFHNKQRTIIVDKILERKGTSVKIGTNKWMIGEKIYDGYTEIYSNEPFDAETFASYEYRDRNYSAPAYNLFSYYIDLDGNLFEDRTWECEVRGTNYDFTSHELIATNVKSIPFMQFISKMPTPRSINGEFRRKQNDGRWTNAPLDEYNALNHYIKEDGYLYEKEGDLVISEKPKDIAFVGVSSKRNSYGSYLNYWNKLYWLESGLKSTVGSHGNFKYANLTVDSVGNVVGDNELVSVTSISGVYESLNELIDSIYNAYENYSTTNSVYVLLGDSIEATMTYDDYESDEAYSQVYDFVHADPNYFENSLGKDPSAGTGLSKPLTTLYYVGHYVVKPKVKDNPKDDDRFSEYRLENNDEVSTNVYVHRQPFALMSYRFGESHIPGYFTLTCEDSESYDLDHLSEAQKGIINWKFGIKNQDEHAWTIVNDKTFTHTKIIPGMQYDTFFMVQDKEKVWSKPVYKSFKLDEIPINLNASIKARDLEFSVNAMPITEYFNIYDIETDYPGELKLEIALYEGDERKGNLITIPFNEGITADTDSSNQNLVKWHSKDLQVLQTLPDKEYKVRVTAIDVASPSKRNVLEFDVGVRTPINPFPTMPQVFTANETVELYCRTSKYTDSMTVTVFNGTSKESTLPMVHEANEGNKKVWKVTYSVPEGLDDGTYNAIFSGTVNTVPAKMESVTRSYEYITLKIISAVMFPEDPMAGDKLTWVIESVGGVDKYEIIFDQDIIGNDERENMGYDAVDYPYYVQVNENVSRKTDELDYILWCTTPQSKTLKDNRNRAAYTFKIRAWKGDSYVDVDFVKEVVGDVRELIKIGY